MVPSSEEVLLDLITVGEEVTVQSPDWYLQLKLAINDLITADFGRLIYVLYRADVSEEKLKKLLDVSRDADAATIIADLLLERQLEKLRSRSQFQPKPGTIPEDESW